MYMIKVLCDDLWVALFYIFCITSLLDTFKKGVNISFIYILLYDKL